MSNALYILASVISAEALWMGADYRAIGVGLIIIGTVTFLRYYT